mmetsp:Transcript_834/g.2380  ORF Transcript_834/g.2380 Transcript_834/m.2380 type:complete len:89 (-) Transcript_834:233-499(-)
MWPVQASAAQRLLAATEARTGLPQYTSFHCQCTAGGRPAWSWLAEPTQARRTAPSSGPAQGTRLCKNAHVQGQLRARRHLAEGVAGLD